MRGGLSLHGDVSAKVMPRQRNEKPKLNIDPTERELAIAKLVGEVRTNKEIAGVLYLSIGTVKNHLTLILQKTGLRDRTQLAIYAVTHGITD